MSEDIEGRCDLLREARALVKAEELLADVSLVRIVRPA
jgi:hypothetical protein